ncbi:MULTISPECIES: cysteine desulfurase family protein [Paenibacillus]|uniref:cysteine desulfurase family protein n=1 Tax=Paenibacillus TaxID=44249 RepID=UPI0004AEAE23|nr:MULTISPECIES: cysteine desulfurase family protein [Paenibacillus]MEC0134726.1 cysteine desulfurase family protein [Paenibacillus odorifer]MEC0221917.1 cysteine desulfurase family protein [Paenibacillus odorifer]
MDYCSSSPLYPQVYDLLLKTSQEYYSNPSSSHSMGYEVSNLVEESRETISSILNVKPSEVIFTSGATESNNIAILGAIKWLMDNKKKPIHIITTSIEHSSVFNCCKELQDAGIEVTFIPVDRNGIVDTSLVIKHINVNTALISIMHVNNETGSIQPVMEIGALIKSYDSNIIFHVDGVQGFGKIPLSLDDIDMYTLSGHKIGAPKGIGILIKKDLVCIKPLIFGGNQEYGLRSGTTNVTGVLCISEAIKISYENLELNIKHIYMLYKYMLEKLQDFPDIIINSPKTPLSSPHILNISFSGVTSAVLIHLFSVRGLIVSSQSACSSKSKKVSRVLMEMTNNEKISSSSIRISLSERTSFEEVEYFITILNDVVSQIKSGKKYII